MAVSGCNDGSLKAWDIARGGKLKSFKGHDEAVWTVHIEGTIAWSLWDVAVGDKEGS